jgi:hypothetical protein
MAVRRVGNSKTPAAQSGKRGGRQDGLLYFVLTGGFPTSLTRLSCGPSSPRLIRMVALAPVVKAPNRYSEHMSRSALVRLGSLGSADLRL